MGQTRNELQAIKTLLGQCVGIQRAAIGIAERPGDVQSFVSVSVLDRPEVSHPTGIHRTEQNYYCEWWWAVGGDEEDAELALADFLDDLEGRILAVRATAGHTLQRIRLVNELSSRPDFMHQTGEEGRIFPFVLALRRDTILPPNA